MSHEVATGEVAASRPGTRRSPWRWEGAAWAGLGLAIACSGTLLLVLQSHLTFLFDDWDFLLYRRGTSPSVFLDPHNEHIVLVPVAIYKALLKLFGMDSAMPFQVIATLIFLLSAALLFVYLRRCVGGWLALLGTTLVLFLGPAWIDLLWPFQIGYSGSIAAGIGMLLALQRGDRAGDRAACTLLAVSLAFSSLGLAFAAGAVLDVALGRWPRAPRLYIPLVPLVLFGAWWLGWGHTAESHLSAHNVLTSPKYVFDAASQAAASLVGLATPSGDPSSPVGLNWGRALLVAAVALAAFRLWRSRAAPRTLSVALAVGLTFWLLAAFNHDVLRPATSGRYQYPGAVFLLLIGAEAVRGARPRTPFAIAVAVIAAAVLASNITFLHRGYERVFKPVSEGERTELAALEIARRTVDPHFILDLQHGGVFLGPIEAGAYLSAVDDYGSPAYSEAELASRPESQRAAADQILAAALPVRLTPVSRPVRAGPCRRVTASATGAAPTPLAAHRLRLAAAPSAGSIEVLLERFSDQLPVAAGRLAPGSPALLTIPADRSDRSWQLGLRGRGVASVCALEG